MGKGVRGDHQPATVRSPHRGAPVRDAVIAGHRGDPETASRLLGHRDAAVRAAALGALDRIGVLDPLALTNALSDPGIEVRRHACVLAGRGFGACTNGAGDGSGGGENARATRASKTKASEKTAAGAELVDALVRVLSTDPCDTVVESAAWSLGEAGPRCGRAAVEALERVTTEHADPLCRESAVAALGAIGDPHALDTVLLALEDKPPVRRRAAIALAAFDDPRVDVAWGRCLEDRDWQVRQAAEDLLGRP